MSPAELLITISKDENYKFHVKNDISEQKTKRQNRRERIENSQNTETG